MNSDFSDDNTNRKSNSSGILLNKKKSYNTGYLKTIMCFYFYLRRWIYKYFRKCQENSMVKEYYWNIK